uniref:Uncharacterized protein n=1 Tax=Mycena chlorophos TaxID=658473 RepID=A0ABQ0LA74_MYCCL|nr:predicted protein [Mycena chlorophos]
MSLVTLNLNGYFPLSTVSAFVSRLEMPSVTMTSLSLEKTLIDHSNLPELLLLFRSLSGVTHFALRVPGPTLQNDVLEALTLPASASGNLNALAGEIIFPALQHLELALGRYNESAVDVATVADLFESRLPAANAQGQVPGRCLVTAKLSSSGDSWREDEDWDRLVVLEERGILTLG